MRRCGARVFQRAALAQTARKVDACRGRRGRPAAAPGLRRTRAATSLPDAHDVGGLLLLIGRTPCTARQRIGHAGSSPGDGAHGLIPVDDVMIVAGVTGGGAGCSLHASSDAAAGGELAWCGAAGDAPQPVKHNATGRALPRDLSMHRSPEEASRAPPALLADLGSGGRIR